VNEVLREHALRSVMTATEEARRDESTGSLPWVMLEGLTSFPSQRCATPLTHRETAQANRGWASHFLSAKNTPCSRRNGSSRADAAAIPCRSCGVSAASPSRCAITSTIGVPSRVARRTNGVASRCASRRLEVRTWPSLSTRTHGNPVTVSHRLVGSVVPRGALETVGHGLHRLDQQRGHLSTSL